MKIQTLLQTLIIVVTASYYALGDSLHNIGDRRAASLDKRGNPPINRAAAAQQPPAARTPGYRQQPPDAQSSAALSAHNAARAAVGVGPLEWSARLAADAGAHAASLASRGCALQHARGTGQGENLAAFYGRQGMSIAKGVNMWVAEKRGYRGQPVGRGNNAGHYTQIAWRSTRQVGCAVSQGRGGCSVVVCRYYPPGNYVGQRPY